MLSVSSSSASSGFLLLFLSRVSQYLARSSGDLLEALASCVTRLLLINLPQAYQHMSRLYRGEKELKKHHISAGYHPDFSFQESDQLYVTGEVKQYVKIRFNFWVESHYSD